jgi:hypothetical protein
MMLLGHLSHFLHGFFQSPIGGEHGYDEADDHIVPNGSRDRAVARRKRRNREPHAQDKGYRMGPSHL